MKVGRGTKRYQRSIERRTTTRPDPLDMRTLACITVGLALAALLLSGCNTRGEQSEFVAQALQPPDGITETDENGSVIGSEDPDDWRTAPLYAGRVVVEPAFPNPVAFGEQVTVGVTLLGFDGVPRGVRIDALRSDGQQLFEITRRPEVDQDGFFPIRFNLSAAVGEAGLVRLILFDIGRNEVISYGDVQIDPAPDAE